MASIWFTFTNGADLEACAPLEPGSLFTLAMVLQASQLRSLQTVARRDTGLLVALTALLD